MASTFSFMDIIIIVCGVYVLYIFYLLKVKGEIRETLLLPKDLPVNKCKDKAAYIAEMSPKVLIYGIVVVLCGVLGLCESRLGLLGNAYLIVLAVFLAVTVWFAVEAKKAVKKYWPT